MILRALIIDDEPPARSIVRQYLSSYSDVELIGECADGPTAVAQIDQLRPDLVFLDIQMPGCSGFEVLGRISPEAVPAHVVFCTAYDRYALKAFEFAAVDYLLKPFDAERFDVALRRVLQRPHDREVLRALGEEHSTQPADRSLLLREAGGRVVRVQLDELQWIEAAKDYCWIHTRVARHLSPLGIGALAKKLDASRFRRVHRSAIVAMHAVKDLGPDAGGAWSVTLTNGTQVRVGRSYLDELRKHFL